MAFLEDYEKIQRIGEGAFATVYKVRHAQLDYIRALKVSKGYIEDTDDKAWQTFMAECKMLLRIGNGSHPNIVRIYQPRLLEHRAVVEMDCVEGESLHDYVKNTGFVPVEEFYNFAHQIVGAVAYCHVDLYKFQMDPVKDHLTPDPNDGRKYIVDAEKEKELIEKYGVVHNDLHSANIIRRDYDGQYVLLDFGLAIQDTHCVKSSSRFDGAIEYCAPEKLERGLVQPASDVYALGILLYEVLAGQVPFPFSYEDGTSPESARNRVYQQHLHDTPPAILPMRAAAFEATHPGQTYRRDYPEAVEKVIMRCLAKDPADRYLNAKELFKDLEKAVKEPVSADSHGGTKFGNAGKVAGAAAGAAVGAAAGAMGATGAGTAGGVNSGNINSGGINSGNIKRGSVITDPVISEEIFSDPNPGGTSGAGDYSGGNNFAGGNAGGGYAGGGFSGGNADGGYTGGGNVGGSYAGGGNVAGGGGNINDGYKIIENKKKTNNDPSGHFKKVFTSIVVALLCLIAAAGFAYGGWVLYNKYISNDNSAQTEEPTENLWNNEWQETPAEAAPAEDYYNNSYATPAADTAVVAVPDSAVAYDYNYGY